MERKPVERGRNMTGKKEAKETNGRRREADMIRWKKGKEEERVRKMTWEVGLKGNMWKEEGR